MFDNVILNFEQFQKKFYEKDLLDQEKEREEILLFEMVCWFHMQYTHF
jgi:serine/threonine-protein phosphatase 4 regulatory subunit 4